MQPTTPHRDAEEERTEENEETIIGRFSKKTPPKKTTISKCWNYCTFRLLVATSAESDLLSRDLKARGFKFVGSTIVYAHMQATGLVNDHLIDCFRYAVCAYGPEARSS